MRRGVREGYEFVVVRDQFINCAGMGVENTGVVGTKISRRDITYKTSSQDFALVWILV